MNPYRDCLSAPIEHLEDGDMTQGEYIALWVVMGLNILSMLAFVYLCVFQTSFMLYRFLGIVYPS